MIKTLISKLFKNPNAKLKAERHHIPRNPLARKTDWHQNHPKGNHLTHATLTQHPDKLFFDAGNNDLRPPFYKTLFGGVLLCIILFFLIMAIPDYLKTNHISFLDLKYLILPTIATIFVRRSYKEMQSLRQRTTLATFDLKSNSIYFGKDDNQVPIAAFADIGALQILSELAVVHYGDHRNGNPEVDVFYELNLVDNSGKRTTLIDTLDLNKIKSIANNLSELLKVPIWDLSALDSTSFSD